MKKFLLWMLGIVGVLVILTIGFGVGMYFFASGEVEEAETFADAHTKHECLQEMASRVSTCSGVTCLMKGIGFGVTCLDSAEGERSQFCVGRQASQSLPANYCALYQDSEYCSQAVVGAVVEYCKSGP